MEMGRGAKTTRVDPGTFRRVMGCFATGVTLVTTRAGEYVRGMTANAISSISLEPPLVMVAIDRRNTTQRMVREGGCFALNILRRDQEWIARRFSAWDKGTEPFADLEITEETTGAPVLKDCIAWLDCSLHGEVGAGDHTVFFGYVEKASTGVVTSAPLVFYGGRFSSLAIETED